MRIGFLGAAFLACTSLPVVAADSDSSNPIVNVVPAPVPGLMLRPPDDAVPPPAATLTPPPRGPATPVVPGQDLLSQPPQDKGLRFTLKQAEAYALVNHPQIEGARLTAESVRQQIQEARSQFFPQVYFNSDSVYAPVGARLAASGGLNNPSVFSRQSDGATLSQLLFDFGRTYELTEAAHFRADAAADRLLTARATVILQVDRAYFDLLRAHAIARVAFDTVKERQTAFNQISILARNQLKSSLDANFAEVNLSEAKLLQIEGNSEVLNAEAELSTALGFPDAQRFILQEEPLDLALPPSPDPLIRQALEQRPELASLRGEQGAADRFARAQEAARYPKISALAAAGVNPISDTSQVKRNYYAAGVNVTAPLFTGGDLEAHAQEAKLLSSVAVQNLIDAQNTISRDVNIAWQDAQTAKQRLDVTAELIKTAAQEEKLASARYRLGTSSIVEFLQAQLNATQARLQDASARYDFQSGRALLNFTIGSNVRQGPGNPTNVP
jgi:outer membrane protein